MGCILNVLLLWLIVVRHISIIGADFGYFPSYYSFGYNNYPYYQYGGLPQNNFRVNQPLLNTYTVNLGGFAPAYDPALLQRHPVRKYSGFIPHQVQHQQNRQHQRHQKMNEDCDNDGEYPSAAENLYKRIYGEQYNRGNPGSLTNELRIIGKEEYFISLIRQKLQKLKREERKRRMRNQLSSRTLKVSVGNMVWHEVLNLDEAEPDEEFRYTTLSTFIGDFFCAWCKDSRGSNKRTCLKHCFETIVDKYDSSGNNRSGNNRPSAEGRETDFT